MIIVRSSSSSPDVPPMSGRWGADGAGGGGAACAGGAAGAGPATEVSVVTLALTVIMLPQRRHFIRTVLPATFSSPIWYLALQLSQMNFIEPRAPIICKVSCRRAGGVRARIHRDRRRAEAAACP
jgi:hypothetical protein